ncbi:MAG: SDR family NAD(P)-dependent oxidoreductase [Proteobacteria bacterium]|nr:SDR family NAD(P)-dependent oxidoreductase [Pseudomonadota bacterium]
MDNHKALHVAIFGASSGIALAIARIYAGRGAKLYLIARDRQKLSEIERDCRARGALDVQSIVADLGSASFGKAASELLLQRCPTLDVVLIAQGVLGETDKLIQDFQSCESLLNLNIQAPIAICHALLPFLRAQKHGTLVIFSSVAGDRGRASNFIYAASKAAMTAYASGLRALLSWDGVHVLTVKPGMVATAMTAHLARGLLMAHAEPVARSIVKAIDKKRDTLYTPGYWRLIMLIIRLLPERIFKKLKF